MPTRANARCANAMPTRANACQPVPTLCQRHANPCQRQRHGGELAAVDCIRYRMLRAKGSGKKRASGIKHAKTVRPFMIGRAMTGAWARMSMQRQGVQESVLPGDNALAPSLAAMPMRRVEAFMENCE
jgi:hypothetical protein